MNRNNGYRAQWVEVLENRQMYSASSHVQVVGTFTGTVVDSNEKLPGTITIIIESETASGKITGLVESKFPHEHTHVNAFTAQINGNVLTSTTSTTSVKVTFSASGRLLTGSYTFKMSDDKSTGHFTATRISQK